MSETAKRIADNLSQVRQRIAAAAQLAGRSPDEITLVGVTKYVESQQAAALAQAGCYDLGESRPQQLWEKAEALHDLPIRWHMIGHLQRNKVRRTLPLTAFLHSVDSIRLLEAIDQIADELALKVSVLLEVHISHDATKGGFAADQLQPLLPQIAQYKHVQVQGLMTMAAREGGSRQAGKDFSDLRRLRDLLRDDCPPEISLDELSMGMSGDFESAIEEGATIVRVGSALFEGLVA